VGLPAGVDVPALVEALWQSPGVGVVVWDADGRYVAVNELIATSNGRPAAEHVGRTLEDVQPPPVAAGMRRLVEEVARSGLPRLGIELVDRERVWETAWLPLCRDGAVVQVACVGLDVAAARTPALGVPGAAGRSAVWTGRLLAVTQALNAAQGAQAALGEAFSAVAAAVGAGSALVGVLEGDRLVFRPDLFATRTLEGHLPLGYALDDPASFSALAVREAAPVWVPDAGELHERFPRAAASIGSADENAWAAVPLQAGGEVLGVLRLAWPAPQTFPPELVAFLRTAADQTAHVLHRVRLLERERALRAESEAAGERVRQLLALARDLSSARNPLQVGEVLAASRYGGTGAVAGGVGLLDESRGVLRVVSTLGGPSWGEVPLSSGLPFVRAAVTGVGQSSTRAEVARLDPRAAAWMDGVGSQLALSVPLHDEERVVGALSVHLAEPAIDATTRQHLQAVAALAGQALGRAAAQEQAQSAVEEIQRALLPRELPAVAGVDVRVGYRASVRAGEIGGDFYDVVARDDGGVVLLLGDVQGHDLTASAIMAQLRALLHTAAAEGEPPAELLSRADRFLAMIEPDRLATVLAVELVPGSGLAAIGVAGHLPPLLVTDAGAALVDVEPGLPLGLLDPWRTEHVLALPGPARLVLLTDGLVERRDEPLGDSLARLAARVPPGPSPDAAELVDRLLSEAPRHTGDDAAVLVADVTDVPQYPRTLTRTLPPGVRTATTARHWARVGLGRLRVDPDVAADALTVLTELVSNAARVTSGAVGVTLARDGGAVLVGVRDDSERRPRARDAAEDDTEGRGLAIVTALTRRWWVEDHATGKTVWAELATD
jgi:GAF domain-containing protein